MAEGAFRHVAAQMMVDIKLDSCGTGGWHAGEAPDRRMQATAKSHGVDISDLRARQFTISDFDSFDRIYVMDTENRANVLRLARNHQDRKKVKLMLEELYPGEEMSVPDPYYGGQQGFEDVFNMLMRSAERVLTEIATK